MSLKKPGIDLVDVWGVPVGGEVLNRREPLLAPALTNSQQRQRNAKPFVLRMFDDQRPHGIFRFRERGALRLRVQACEHGK